VGTREFPLPYKAAAVARVDRGLAGLERPVALLNPGGGCTQDMLAGHFTSAGLLDTAGFNSPSGWSHYLTPGTLNVISRAVEQGDGKIIMASATEEGLKSMPEYDAEGYETAQQQQ